jgi:hypothetical protein
MKIRTDLSANYKAAFLPSGKTARMRLRQNEPFGVPKTPEIEDVAINSKCLANCFVAGSLVQTLNGLKPIEQIKIGDEVISYGEEDHRFHARKVYSLFTNTFRGNLVNIELANNKIIRCTPNHRFLTKRGWIKAEDLLESDELISFEDQKL